MSHIFGPVPSRRLGVSLGLDLVRPKTCSFDCIYCQLGSTTLRTVERKEYVPHKEVLEEVRGVLQDGVEPDYFTLSGSGEPTLNSCAGKLLEGIKKMTDIQTAVLTNSSLLHLRKVRKEISQADLVVPSLDAATEAVFRRVNRPHPSIRLSRVLDGLTEFSKCYDGKLWLEVMLVQGYNDDDEQLDALSKAISKIEPEKVQLNTVVRPPAESFAKPISDEKLKEISQILGAETIPEFKGSSKAYSADIEGRIVSLLSRRPCTLSDICAPLGLHTNEVVKYLGKLERAGKITTQWSQDRKYYAYKSCVKE